MKLSRQHLRALILSEARGLLSESDVSDTPGVFSQSDIVEASWDLKEAVVEYLTVVEMASREFYGESAGDHMDETVDSAMESVGRIAQSARRSLGL